MDELVGSVLQMKRYKLLLLCMSSMPALLLGMKFYAPPLCTRNWSTFGSDMRRTLT